MCNSFLLIFYIITTFCNYLIQTQVTSDCGTKYGCYRFPEYCKNNECTYLYKWKNNANVANIDFEIYVKTGTVTNKWISIGFSKDKEIGDDNLVVCNTKNTVKHYFTSNTNQTELIDTNLPSVGISDASVQTVEGFIKCTFTRAKLPNSANNKYYDLNLKHYLVASYGDFDDATPDKIQTIKGTTLSPQMIQFSSVLVDSNNFILTSSDCNQKAYCFRLPNDCKDNSCLFLYKWRNNGNSVDFEIAGKLKTFTNKWLAVGFSKDNKMGDDSVVACKTTKTSQNYYNTDTGSEIVDTNNPTIGISNTRFIEYDEHFICLFSKQKEISSPNTKYFNLTQKYYLLAAHGDLDAADPNVLKQHLEATLSTTTIDFTLALPNGGGKLINFKYDLFLLMLILFISTLI